MSTFYYKVRFLQVMSGQWSKVDAVIDSFDSESLLNSQLNFAPT